MKIPNFKKTVLYGLATGLYPMIFFYTNNFSLINSWKHFFFFIGLFLVAPICLFLAIQLFSYLPLIKKSKPFVFPFLNVAAFLGFIQICLYAKLQWAFTIVIIVVAALFTLFFRRHFKKVVVLQLVLAIIGLFWLVPTLKNQWTYSNEWTQQPDDIEEVVFKKRPNVYYIQPDGYINISEFDNGGYAQIDNSDYWGFLRERGFKIYPNIRSNYSSTLTSNSATFTMKHHYYNNGFDFNEMANTRNIIISDNPVLNIFKNNGYKTHFFAEYAYLLSNLPEMGYDVCNFDYNEIDFITKGFDENQDVSVPLKEYLSKDINTPKFFFIELLKPGHVEANKNETLGKQAEAEKYATNLKMANERLKNLIRIILEKDPDGLILIMADHGGYVGYEYSLEVRNKTMDRDRIYSAFSTQLSIKWPNGTAPDIDKHFKSGINTFRVLFSYLSENNAYLDYLQEDATYAITTEGAPRGIYKVIDSTGNIVFEKH